MRVVVFHNLLGHARVPVALAMPHFIAGGCAVPKGADLIFAC
jgi:hypothetical protein